MDWSSLKELLIPIVVLACLIAGYVLKHSLDFIPNKYIPLILTVLGILLALVMSAKPTVEVAIYGAFSGLASTGLHQAFKQMLESGSKNKDSF